MKREDLLLNAALKAVTQARNSLRRHDLPTTRHLYALALRSIRNAGFPHTARAARLDIHCILILAKKSSTLPFDQTEKIC